ncbi:DUF4412 domain-containing protein [Woeseia oceani]|uniref:DUF4412 domain-containing protein n=1 Tax=Woeseia oceani TaxID=1548547 RepID=A0A193LIZ4_9GAMM|nr:DUF4412 domain-containing protein [Woeseia oceani]ANO52477.1 hypothetical protein BA177_15940 [Woeseia oceani]
MRLQILLVLLIPQAAAFADVEMTFDDGSIGLVRDNMVLFGDAQSAVLFNSRNDELIIISRQDRTWMRVETGLIEAMTAQMQKEMEDILASVPAEQRAMVEEQMQGMLAQEPDTTAAINVRRTGRTDRVAGYDCHEAEVTIDGSSNTELVCIATAEELGISQADYTTLNAAMRGIAEIAAMSPQAGASADLSRMGGIPIRTHNLAQDYRTALTTIAHEAIDSARLAIPAGFKETTLEEMLAQ